MSESDNEIQWGTAILFKDGKGELKVYGLFGPKLDREFMKEKITKLLEKKHWKQASAWACLCEVGEKDILPEEEDVEEESSSESVYEPVKKRAYEIQKKPQKNITEWLE